MRSLMALAIVAVLAGPAHAQMPPMGIPLGEPKPEKPIDPGKESDYRSAIGGMPTPKSADPWGSVRDAKPAAPATGKKTPAAGDKGTSGTKKNSSTAKTTDTPKKTN